METTTKFDQLKAFALRRKSFRFKDVNKNFGFRAGDLNSYTTYLNYLVQAGYLTKEDGRYSTPDRVRLRNAELGDILVRNKLKRAIREYLELDESMGDLRYENSDLRVQLTRANQTIEQYKESERQLVEHGEEQRKELASARTALRVHQEALSKLESRWYVRLADKVSAFFAQFNSENYG